MAYYVELFRREWKWEIRYSETRGGETWDTRDGREKKKSKSLLCSSPSRVRGVKEDYRLVGYIGVGGLSTCDGRDRSVTEVDSFLVRTEDMPVLPSRSSWRALFALLRVS